MNRVRLHAVDSERAFSFGGAGVDHDWQLVHLYPGGRHGVVQCAGCDVRVTRIHGLRPVVVQARCTSAPAGADRSTS